MSQTKHVLPVKVSPFEWNSPSIVQPHGSTPSHGFSSPSQSSDRQTPSQHFWSPPSPHGCPSLKKVQSVSFFDGSQIWQVLFGLMKPGWNTSPSIKQSGWQVPQTPSRMLQHWPSAQQVPAQQT